MNPATWFFPEGKLQIVCGEYKARLHFLKSEKHITLNHLSLNSYIKWKKKKDYGIAHPNTFFFFVTVSYIQGSKITCSEDRADSRLRVWVGTAVGVSTLEWEETLQQRNLMVSFIFWCSRAQLPFRRITLRILWDIQWDMITFIGGTIKASLRDFGKSIPFQRPVYHFPFPSLLNRWSSYVWLRASRLPGYH